MNLLLSETLPLRMAISIGDFDRNDPLPHRYGDLSQAPFPAIKLTADKWFAADHPMTITGVFVDRESTSGWESAIESDGYGNSWTVINLAAPAPSDATVSAVGFGKTHPDTGAVIENPADIFVDVLRIAGRETSWSSFRDECSAVGLRLAGSIDAVASVRSHLDVIAKCAGAVWTPEMARLYPVPVPAGLVIDLGKLDVSSLRVSASLTDTGDVLSLVYHYDAAADRPKAHMQFTASPQRMGGVVVSRELKWIASATNAQAIGTRLLERIAGERYDVDFRSGRTDLRPGRWVRLLDHPEWPFAGESPTLMITAVEIDPDTRATAITAEHVRSRPRVDVTAHSVALPNTTDAGVDVAFRNGNVTLTFVDNDGRPLGDARVSFDGGAPRRTNAQGRVVFPASSGTHYVAVEATGKIPFTFEIVL